MTRGIGPCRSSWLASPAPISRRSRPRCGSGGSSVQPATRDLRDASGLSVDLTSYEFELLVAFLGRPGEAISRAELTHALKGRTWDVFDRSIDTLVARLRKKIDQVGAPSLIRSARGVGYVFCAPVARCGEV